MTPQSHVRPNGLRYREFAGMFFAQIMPENTLLIIMRDVSPFLRNRYMANRNDADDLLAAVVRHIHHYSERH